MQAVKSEACAAILGEFDWPVNINHVKLSATN